MPTLLQTIGPLAVVGLILLAAFAALVVYKFAHVVQRDGQTEIWFGHSFAVTSKTGALALILLGVLLLIASAVTVRLFLAFSSIN